MDKSNFIELTDTPFNLWPAATKESIAGYFINNSTGTNNLLVVELIENSKVIISIKFQEMEFDSTHFNIISYKLFDIHYTSSFEENYSSYIKPVKEKFKKLIADNNIDFCFADIPSRSRVQNTLLFHLGFKFILNWLDGFWQTKNLNLPLQGTGVREAVENDLDQLSLMAYKYYYKEGRFYTDENYDKEKVNLMYKNLIKNSFISNDIILVKHINEKPVGAFIIKKIKTYTEFENLRVAPLRFLVIDPELRGRNLGAELFTDTLMYLKSKSDIITTGLETHNLISLNLHSRLSVKFNYSHNAYHYWSQSE